MSFDPISSIRRRSREQWQQWASDHYSSLRTWMQQNGDKASVAAFALGIALVLFYKFIIGLFALAVIGAFVAWNIALPDAQHSQASRPDSDSGVR